MQCGSYGNSSWLSAQPELIAQLAREEGTAVQALAVILTLCSLPNIVFLSFFFFSFLFFWLIFCFLKKWKSEGQLHLPLSPL